MEPRWQGVTMEASSAASLSLDDLSPKLLPSGGFRSTREKRGDAQQPRRNPMTRTILSALAVAAMLATSGQGSILSLQMGAPPAGISA